MTGSGILFDMNLHTAASMPTLSNEAFEALPESICSYIRYLENVIQQQQTQIQEHSL